jgi:hypothetical protein
MWIRLNPATPIEDLGNHGAQSVEKLRALLASGAAATLDPQRQNFYEVANCSHVYYVHLCPSGKVLFLATWPKESAGSRPAAPDQAAAASAL